MCLVFVMIHFEQNVYLFTTKEMWGGRGRSMKWKKFLFMFYKHTHVNEIKITKYDYFSLHLWLVISRYNCTFEHRYQIQGRIINSAQQSWRRVILKLRVCEMVFCKHVVWMGRFSGKHDLLLCPVIIFSAGLNHWDSVDCKWPILFVILISVML